ncbi:MAG: VWA domain-containing protein [Thermoleophilia bacterium]|nr:VWA domain-containing protein [Thermoleophilia bacterium]MDH3724532.1 VWA domain-containing protein [Thermoleophilia bacterium]
MTEIGPIVFQAPEWLLAVLLVPVLGVLGLLWWRRAGRAAAAYADPRLVDVRSPRWSRNAQLLGGLLGLLAITALAVGAARPSVDVTREEERGTVILAIDTSLSMRKDDLQPSRLVAASDAAKRLLGEAPDSTAIGLVNFADRARTLVTPTVERAVVAAALDDLPEPREGTALGDAVATSLSLLSGAGVLEEIPANSQDSPARIVLLTDGARTLGLEPSAAAARAQAVQVPVFTILVGDDPPHPRFGDPRETLALLATQTGGTYTQTTDDADLARVFEDIGKTLTPVQRLRELTVWLVAAALGLLSLAGLVLALGRPRQAAWKIRGVDTPGAA